MSLEGTHFNIIRALYDKPSADIIVHRATLKTGMVYEKTTEGAGVLRREHTGHHSSPKANRAHWTTTQRFWSKWHTEDFLPVSRQTVKELQIGIIITASLLFHH